MTPEPHEGRIFIVSDDHGYAAGRSSECSCGWQSNELREREGQALIDHFQHLAAAGIRPKERTT
jgi:hypothetical protein